jgi:hypothetical protein
MSKNLIVKVSDDDLSDDEGIGCNNCYACVSGGRFPCQNQHIICTEATNDKDIKENPIKKIKK